jgi:hypothetical protein
VVAKRRRLGVGSFRARHIPHLSPRGPRLEAEVHVLVAPRVVRVEATDRLEQGAPNEQHGTRHRKSLLIAEKPLVGDRRAHAVVGGQAPEHLLDAGVLKGPIGVPQTRPAYFRGGMLRGEVEERANAAGSHVHIVVEEE